MHNTVCESLTKLQMKTSNRDCKVETNKGQRKCIIQPNKLHNDKTKKKINKRDAIYTHTQMVVIYIAKEGYRIKSCSNIHIVGFYYYYIIDISFMQGIYTYIPETNHVPREHCVRAILM